FVLDTRSMNMRRCHMCLLRPVSRDRRPDGIRSWHEAARPTCRDNLFVLVDTSVVEDDLCTVAFLQRLPHNEEHRNNVLGEDRLHVLNGTRSPAKESITERLHHEAVDPCVRYCTVGDHIRQALR